MVSFTAEDLTLSIADVGRGFDPARAPLTSQGHFGLSSMRERPGGRAAL
jgi:signal transduction histidine kinase